MFGFVRLQALLERIASRSGVAEMQHRDDYVQLSLDRLEDRRVLSVTVAVGVDNILYVTGDGDADDVTISLEDAGLPGQSISVFEGASELINVATASLAGIDVNLGGGNDQLHLMVPPLPVVVHDAGVADGFDTVFLADNPGLVSGLGAITEVHAESIQFVDSTFTLPDVVLDLHGTLTITQDVSVTLAGGSFDLHGHLTGTGNLSIESSSISLSLGDDLLDGQLSLDAGAISLSGNLTAHSFLIDGPLSLSDNLSLTATASGGGIEITDSIDAPGGPFDLHLETDALVGGDLLLHDVTGIDSLTLAAPHIHFDGDLAAESIDVDGILHVDGAFDSAHSITAHTGEIDFSGAILQADNGANLSLISTLGGVQLGDASGIHLFEVTAAGAIVLMGDVSSTDDGSISLTTSRNILLTSGSSLTTENGGITLLANNGGTTAGNFIGIEADNALIEATGTGNISLTGFGADNGEVDSQQAGIYLHSGSIVRSTLHDLVVGTISLSGTGGSGTSDNYGVWIQGTGTKVTSLDGDITITGQGGTGSGGDNHGLVLDGAMLQVTSALLDVTGTGGNGNSTGVLLDATNGGQILSVGSGDILVTATGHLAHPDLSAGVGTVIGGTGAFGDITLLANTIDLSGPMNIQSTGDLTIRPRTDGTSIGLGDGAAGTLNLDSTELGYLHDGFNSITIGKTSSPSGQMNVNAVSFQDDLTLAADKIAVGGTLQMTEGSLTIIGSGSTTTLSANIVTAGGAVLLNDSVLIDGDITIDTTDGGTVATGANVTITGAVDGAQSGGFDRLTIQAGSTGAVELQGAVEGASGSQSVTGGEDLEELAIEAATILIGANVTTTGEQNFTGDLTLGDNLTFTGVDTDASGTGVQFHSEVLGAGFDLTVAGGGRFEGAVSGVASLNVDELQTADTITAEDITVTGDAHLGGSVSATAGSLSINGILVLEQNITLEASDAIDVGQDVQGAFNLTLDAVNGTTVTGTIGGPPAEQVQNLVVQNGALEAGSIDIAGNLTAQGPVSTTTGAIQVGGDVDAESTLAAATDVEVQGNSELGGNVTAQSGRISLGSTAAHNVTLTNSIALEATDTISASGNVSGPWDLSLSSGNGTDVAGLIGSDINSLTVSQGSLTAGEIDITGNLETHSTLETTAGGIHVGGTSDLGGNVTSQTFIDFDGSVTLTDDVTLDAGTTINADSSIDGSHNLTLHAVDGTTVTGTIGPNIQNLGVTAGTLEAGAIDITGDLTATAAVSTTTGAISVGGNVDAESTLTSATDIVVQGTSELGNDVTSQTGKIELQQSVTLTGDVDFSASTTISVTGDVNGPHDVSFSSGSGTQVSGTIGPDVVNLTVVAGELEAGSISIVGALETHANVTATTGDIHVGTTSSLGGNLTTLAGAIDLDGAVTLTSDVTIDAATTLDVDGGIDGPHNLTITSGGGALVTGTIGSTIQNLTLTAGTLDAGGIDITGNLETHDNLTAGFIHVAGATALGGNLTSTTGDVSLGDSAADDVTLTSDVDIKSTTTLAVSGDISGSGGVRNLSIETTAGADVAGDITGNIGNLTLVAGPLTAASVNISGDLATSDDLTADTGDIIVGGSSDLGGDLSSDLGAIDLQGAVTLSADSEWSAFGTIDAGSTVNGAHALSLSSGSDITFQGAVGGLAALSSVMISTANDVTFTSTLRTTGNVQQQAGTGRTRFNGTSGTGIGGTLEATTQAVTFESGTVNTAGNVSISTGDDVTFAAGAGLNAGASTISFDVNTDGGSQGFTQAADSVIQTTSDSLTAVQVSVGGTGSASVATIQAGTTSGVISITAGGSILDANTLNENANLTAAAVALRAQTGIGVGDDLNTNVDQLAFSTAAGGIALTNTGALQITAVDGLLTSTANGGGFVQAASPLTISSDVNFTGNMTFTAGASASVGDQLTVDANLTGDGSGFLALEAGDDIVLQSGVIQNTGGAVNEVRLHADTEGAVDADRGGITQTGGQILADRLVVRAFDTVALNQLNNVDVLAGVTSGTGSFSFRDTSDLTVGTVDGISGIASNGNDITLQTGGLLTIGTGTGQSLNVGGTGTVSLDAASGGVSEAAGSVITAQRLLLEGTGTFTLNENNDVGVLAADINGALRFRDINTLQVGTVGLTDGIDSTSGNITLHTGGLLTIGSGTGQGIDAGTGTVALDSAGGVTEAAGSTITADKLALTGSGTFTLTENNNVETLAADINGSLNYHDVDTLSVGTVTADSTIVGISTGDPLPGGGVTITTGDTLTIDNTISTLAGSGGTISVSGAVLNAALIAGAGNINLTGGGEDLVINVAQSSATSTQYSARRDVIINAEVETTGPAADLTITADSDANGTGGVWVKGPGKVDSARDLTISGSDLFATPLSNDSIRIDADGVNDQLAAGRDLTLQNNAAAPVGADVVIDGRLHSVGGNVSLTSADQILAKSVIAADAGNIAFHSPLILTGDLQVSASGTVTFDAAVDDDGSLPTTSDLTVTAAGLTRFNSTVGQSAALTSLVTNGGGATELNGDVTTVNQVQFSDDVVLTNHVMVTSQTSSISFLGTVDSEALAKWALSASAAGSVQFAQAVGGAANGELGGLTVVSGPLTIQGNVTVAGNIDITSTTASIDQLVTTTAGGFVEITNSGLLTLGNGASFQLDGAFLQNGTGNVQSGADITTTGDNITFAGNVTLTDDISLDTSAGIGNVVFQSDVSGDQLLTIIAGAGNVDFQGIVGAGTPLSGLLITSSQSISFADDVFLDDQGLNITSTGAISLSGDLKTTSGGTAQISNGGLLTLANGTLITLDGAFSQIGAGNVSTGADIVTTGDAVSFASAVTLTGTVSIDTTFGFIHPGGAPVTFSSTVNATTAGVEGISVTAGASSVTFTGNVGNLVRLGTVEIAYAQNVLFSGTLTAGRVRQLSAGPGTTTFNGAVNTNLADGIDLNGNAFTFNAPVTTTGGGTVQITNASILTIAAGANFILDGAFTQDGAGNVVIGANITTTGDAISFSGPVRLASGSSISLNTTSGVPAGASISFLSTLNGTTANTESLTLNAGTGGDVLFAGTVGNTAALGITTITSAHDVDIQQAFNAAALRQLAGTGQTTIDGVTTLNAIQGLDLKTSSIVVNQLVDTRTAGTGGIISLVASDDVEINSTLKSGSGAITVLADDDATFSAAGLIDSVTGDIIVRADADNDADGNGGALFMADGSVIQSLVGTITLSSDENLVLGHIENGNVTAAAISITSTSGAILDGNTGIDVVANDPGATVTMTAKNGIGTAVNAIETQISRLVASVTDSGPIRIVEADSINLASVTTPSGLINVQAGGAITAVNVVASGGTDADDVTLQGTSIEVGTITAAGAGDVSLTATVGSIDDVDANSMITADDLSFTTPGSFGGTNAIHTQVNEIVTGTSTGAGAIRIVETDGIVLTHLTNTNGLINVQAGGAITAVNVVASGGTDTDDVTLQGTSIEVGTITAAGAGDVSLTATTGSIDDVDANSMITADDLSFTTPGSFGGTNAIHTQVNEIVTGTSTGAGAIRIVETDDIVLTHLTNTNGLINVQAGGAITAVNVVASGGTDADDVTLQGTSIEVGTITAAGAGDVSLTATVGSIDDVDANSMITADDLSFTTPGSFGGTNAIHTQVNEIVTGTSTGAGAIRIVETDGIVLTHLTNTNGLINVQAGGAITAVNVVASGGTDVDDVTLQGTSIEVGTITATGAGDVSLTATSGDIDDADANSIVTADELRFTATGGTGVTNPLNTNVATLVFGRSTVAGDIRLNESNAITVQELTTASGSIELTAGGTTTLDKPGPAGTVVSAGGAGSILVDVNGAASDLLVNDAVVSAGGSITLLADNHVQFSADGDVQSNNGNVRVEADADLQGNGALTQADGAQILAGSSTVLLAAAGDVTLANVQTSNSTAAAVSITSRLGGLVDGGETDLDIIADSAGALTTIRTATGVGTAANPIETRIAELDLINTTSGDVQIREQNDLTVRQLKQTGPGTGDIDLRTVAGSITLDAPGTATVVAAAGAGRSILIDANGAASNLSVQDAVTSQGGPITLEADNDISFGAAGDVSSSNGNIRVEADADLAGGGKITQMDGTVVHAGAGEIVLLADGEIALGSLQTTNATTSAVSVTSRSGSITDAGDTDLDILANSAGALVTLRAATGVGSNGGVNSLETSIHSLDVFNSTSGDISLREQDALIVRRAEQGGTGHIDIRSVGSLTVDNGGAPTNAVIALGTGQIRLEATGNGSNLTLNSGVSGAQGSIDILAENNVQIAATGDVSSTTGNIQVRADSDGDANGTGGSLFMGDGAVISSTSGTITVRADGNITIGSVQTGNATSLAVGIVSTSGALLDGGETDLDIVADAPGAVTTISTRTGTGTAANPLETQVARLDVTNSLSGDIQIREENAVTVLQLTQGGPGNIDLRTVNGTITVGTGAAGNVVSSLAAGTIRLDANGAAADLVLMSGVASVNGQIQLLADRHVQFDANGDVTSTTGDVSVAADEDLGGSGAVTMDNQALINAGSGRITITSSGDIQLGGLQTTRATNDAVSLTSRDGGITDGGDAFVDVVAVSGQLNIDARTGVGSANALETTVDRVSILNRTSGNIDLLETNGLNVIGLTQDGPGTSRLISGGTMTVVDGGAGVSAQTGTVTLTANGASSDLVLNEDVTTRGGHVFLSAGRHVLSTLGDDIITTAASGVASGNVTIAAHGTGRVELRGNVTTTGAANAAGGNILITTDDGTALVTRMDVSGGPGGATGGNSGNITITTGDADASGNSHITLTGTLTAVGGTGTVAGADGTVRLTAAGDIIDGNDGQTLITTGDLWLAGRTNVGEITDFEARTGNAIDAIVRGTLRELSITEAGGNLHLNVTGDLVAAASSINPDADGAATVLIQKSTDLDVGSFLGALVLTNGDNVGLHSGQTLILPDAGLDVGTGKLRLSGGLDVVDPAGRELGKLTADTLIFESGSAGGTTTLVTNVREIVVDMSTAPATSNLIINEDNALIVKSVVSGGGDVRINSSQVAAGDMTVQRIDAGNGNVMLSTVANGGQIIDGDETQVNIIANGLALRATGGIANNERLEVQVQTLAATTQQGDINVVDLTGNLTVGTVDGLNGLSITAGAVGHDIEVSSVGQVSVQRNVVNTGGNVLVAADGNTSQLQIAAGVQIISTATAGTIQLLAGSHVTMGTGAVVSTDTGSIDVLAGVRFNTAGVRTSGDVNASVLMSNISLMASRSGNITVRALGDVDVSRIDANSDGIASLGNVIISADDNGLAGAPVDGVGQIRDSLAGETTNIRANVLSLSAATGIGSVDDLQTDVNSVSAVNTTSGNIRIFEVQAAGDNPLIVTSISNVSGNIDVRTQDGDLTVSGPVSTTLAGGVTLIAGDSGGNGNGDLAINASITNANGPVTLTSSANNVTFGAAGNVTSQSGNVAISAGAADGSGAVLQNQNSLIHSGTGKISLSAQGQISLGRLVSLNTANDAVSIVTPENLASANPGDPSLVNITAAGGRLVIDTGAGVSPLRTTVQSLDLLNRNSSSITLIETDAIDIVRVAQQATTGPLNIDLSSGGTMRFVAGGSGLTATTGDVRLRALGGASDIDVAATLFTTTGRITAIADHDVQLRSTSLIDTSSTSTLIIGGGDPALPDTTTGGVFMADGALINAHAGKVDVRGETGVAVGRIVTTSDIRLTSANGAITDAGDTGGADLVAANLGLSAATGIGSANALETQIANFAARNTVSGNIQLSNSTGTLLTIGTFTDATLGNIVGITNSGTGLGTVVVTNQGPMTLAGALSNTSGGQVSLTAAANGGNDDHLTVQAPIFASGTAADILLTAGTDLVLVDTAAANDLEGKSITGTAARNVVYADGFVVKSSTGSVTNPTPLLENVSTPQVKATGIAVIQGNFGRPGDNTFVFLITWDTEGPVQDEFDTGEEYTYAGDGTTAIAPGIGPDVFNYDHFYSANPNEANPAADIPITMTLFDDRNITFIANGQDLGVVSITSLADTTGLGIAGTFVFDVSIEVPPIEAPRVVLGATQDQIVIPPPTVTQSIDIQSVAETETSRDERIIILEKIGLKGRVELDPEGEPLQILVRGEEAQVILNNLSGLYERLEDGRWRIYLQESEETQPQLMRDVTLRNGKPAGEDSGTQDRPPTDSTTDSTHDPLTGGDGADSALPMPPVGDDGTDSSPDSNLHVPPPLSLPERITPELQGDPDNSPVSRNDDEGSSVRAAVLLAPFWTTRLGSVGRRLKSWARLGGFLVSFLR